MVATIAAGTSTAYYLAQTEYYLGGGEPAGRWIAAGPGLGVTLGAAVEREAFERLHLACDEAGRSLLTNSGGRRERVAGFDVTFSAPKSVSLLWAIGDSALRDAVERVQERAVASAIAILDREAAFCRRGHGGMTSEAVRLTVAGFRHGEARPTRHADGTVFASPALHHHACLLAIAQRADGSIGALDGRALFAWKMAAGAVYHAELAAGLGGLGFGVEPTGNNGLFEVSGVDRSLCAFFSPRRREIEKELALAGVQRTADAPALAAAKARSTRSTKTIARAGEDRHAFWRARAAEQGFVFDRVVAEALQRGQEAARELTFEKREALVRDRVDRVPRVLTETGSLIEHRHLVAAVAGALVGTGVGADRAAAEVERLVEAGSVLALARDGRWPHPIYSTPEVIALESEVRDHALHLAATTTRRSPDQARLSVLADEAGLNVEQAEAANEATQACALSVIEGAPGVGKSTLLRPVVQAWREAGWTVVGASASWKVAHALRDDLGIEARAIDSWLTGAAHGRPFLGDRTLLVVDEAGLLSSRQMHRILTEVERARRSGADVALRLCGDSKQLQPIGGPGLRIVAQAVGVRRVDTIVRQREVWARAVVTHFGAGQALEALELLGAHGAVRHCVDAQGTSSAIVAGWREARRADPGLPAPLVIARTNAQVLRLNSGLRDVLRQDGVLAFEDGAVLPAVTASGREHPLSLAMGDRLRFLVRSDALGVINGTEAVLTGIERGTERDGGGDVRLHVRVGDRAFSFAPSAIADSRGRVRLGHAYATTIYGAQGLTTETALVWVDAALDRHDIFVAASRARASTTLFVDGASVEAQVRSGRPLAARADRVFPAERSSALIRSLSRAREKTSTLDCAPAVGASLAPTLVRPPDRSGRSARAEELDSAEGTGPRGPTRQRHGDRGRDA